MKIIFDANHDEINLPHDHRWTAEALFNIIDNAVKYGEANTVIEITIKKFELFLKIDIANKGLVIPEHEQGKIFARFYRGQNTSLQEGSGIGLYLSREIVSRQGGYIKVKSDQDKTLFSVFLPLEI
ncbi:Sensor histidine kinase ResE [bioreactor metagenome]|uniref:histidine kinase n=1 Tax=bioreactor metagenome TaxID=1076179 RepID=A0A645I9A2_9ZZZZ